MSSLLDSGPDTVTFVFADLTEDEDGNRLWKLGTDTLTIVGASVTPIGSSSYAGQVNGQPESRTASVVTRSFEADIDRLFYGHVLWNDTVYVMTEKPRHYHRSPSTAHWAFSMREVLRHAEIE